MFRYYNGSSGWAIKGSQGGDAMSSLAQWDLVTNPRQRNLIFLFLPAHRMLHMSSICRCPQGGRGATNPTPPPHMWVERYPCSTGHWVALQCQPLTCWPGCLSHLSLKTETQKASKRWEGGGKEAPHLLSADIPRQSKTFLHGTSPAEASLWCYNKTSRTDEFAYCSDTGSDGNTTVVLFCHPCDLVAKCSSTLQKPQNGYFECFWSGCFEYKHS